MAKYGTFYNADNRTVKRVAKSCAPALTKRVAMGPLIACGIQGCVYETGKPNTVVKVTAGRNTAEVDQILWRRSHGERSHTALPRIRQVYHLDKCAKAVGVKTAYATVREDLMDVPATRHTRAAVTLLERLEDDLMDAPGTYKAAHAVLSDFMHRHHRALEKLHANTLAWTVWTHIAHLQVWLAYRGYTMGDIRLSNLGIRKPGYGRGHAFDVVMRDMGFLRLRSAAKSREHARFKQRRKTLPNLGRLDPLLDLP